jgi:hypothetical protein
MSAGRVTTGLSDAEVRDLVRVVFGPAAAATVGYRPGAPLTAARRTESEQNTFERTLTGIIRTNLGSRAAAVHVVAETLLDSWSGNTWPMANDWEAKRFTEAQLTLLKKPLPR